MSRRDINSWLSSAGLDRYSGAFAQVTAAGFLGLLMQDYAKYGVTDIEDKQRLFRLIKSINKEVEQARGLCYTC